MTNEFEFGRIQYDYDWWIYGGVLAVDPRPADCGSTAAMRSNCRGSSASGCRYCGRRCWLDCCSFISSRAGGASAKSTFDSRALLLVDTSLSMGKTDPDTPGGRAGKSRLQQVAAALDDTDFVARLRKKHQVSVIPFNSVVEQQQRVDAAEGGRR